MRDDNKTKDQLVEELAMAHQLNAELINSASEHKRIEEEQRRSEAKYRFLTENMNDIVWTADLDLNVTYYSPAVERVLGFNVNERMTLEAHRMLTPDSFAMAVNALHAELGRDQDEGSDPGRSVKLELEYYHKNGSTVWMECVVTAIRDDSGKSIGIHGVSRDITDRKRAEAALRKSEERFRSLIQKSLDIIIVLDGNGVMTYETPSLESILGYQPGYLIGKSPFEFIHPADLERVANDLNEVYLKTNPGVPTELRIRKVNGTWVYLEAIGQNLLEDPAINGIVITSRDITERKRVEDILNNSEKRYRLLAENARDVIWVLDENLRYTFVSPSVKKLRGYTPEEVMNQTIDQVLTPGSYQVAMDIFVKELDFEKSGRGHHLDWSMTLELELICKDGSTVWTEVNISLIYDEAGNPTGILGLTRDIADRKQAEGELKKHRDHLEDLVRERTAKLIQANERLKQEIEESKRAKDALRMNEEIYRIHFSLSNDVLFTSDKGFRILSITPNVERVLGYKPKELVGRTFQEMDVLHPDDIGRAYDEAKHVISGGATHHPTFRFITKDGKTKYGEMSGVPLIKKGHGTTLISVARDVTERVEKEQALIETLDRYSTHFSLTDDIMFSFDHKLRVKSISPNVEKVLGYKPEDIIGKPVPKLGVLSPGYIDEALDEGMHLLSGQTINSSIYEFITKDGKQIFGEVSSSPIIRDGRVVEVISVAREITHKLNHGKSLRETEATAQALLNACTDFMVLIDITGTIIYINKAAAQNLGRSVKELLGTCLFDYLPKEVVNRRKIYFEQVTSSGKPVRFKDDNRGRLVYSSLFPVYNELGKVIKIAIYARNIT